MDTIKLFMEQYIREQDYYASVLLLRSVNFRKFWMKTAFALLLLHEQKHLIILMINYTSEILKNNIKILAKSIRI